MEPAAMVAFSPTSPLRHHFSSTPHVSLTKCAFCSVEGRLSDSGREGAVFNNGEKNNI